ncbi:MAG: SET domain-containing protein [Ginsengibacter sp.]
MSLPQIQLRVKKSGIPGAGNGLFTQQFIARGARITEYTGEITTWKKVLQIEKETKVLNRYLYYLHANHVIDADNQLETFARYANDAKGLMKISGLVNNCKYVEDNGRVFMEATKNIPAGAEILISYGREYWAVVENINKD